MSAIDVRGLEVVRGGAPVLHGLSCSVPTGTVTGLLGPSGSGKTTLIRSIVGVQLIASGTVTVLGEQAGARSVRERVGYMTQAPSVYSDLTVLENLRFFARVVRAPAEAIDAVVAAVSLEAEARRIVARLSGGQRARVSLAVALLGDPDLLVLDEPTVGLDPVLRRDLWQLFHALAGRGKTLLVSSHVMDEADRCDALLLLRQGEVLAEGTPADLRSATGADDLDEAFLRLVERGNA